MANLSTSRTTADVAASHVADHNTLHAFHNLIDAAGDLIVGTGVDTAGRLAKGAALSGLRVNAAGTALEFGSDAASSVVFTPAAGVAATNVQAAIEEVVSDATATYVAKSAQTAVVSTQETTTSTTYADLPTPGPAVTVTVPASGAVLVSIHSNLYNAAGYAFASFAVSGASTLASLDEHAIYTSGTDMAQGIAVIVTGLTPGVCTFTMKYKMAVGGNARFEARKIGVQPL